jgi:ORF6N domain
LVERFNNIEARYQDYKYQFFKMCTSEYINKKLFMVDENRRLRSQNVTLKQGQHSKYGSMAFTEQGVAMLSSVLKSERSIQVNIQIIGAFSKLRHLILGNDELRQEIESLRTETEGKFIIVFQTLDRLIREESIPAKKIGFTAKEKQTDYTT